jgi:hypothetical protein
MSDESSIGRTVPEHGSQDEPDAQGFCARCGAARQVRCATTCEIVSRLPDRATLAWMSLIIMT